MACLIRADGTSEEFKWEGIKSFDDHIGDIAAAAPVSLHVGYSVYVDDSGLLKDLPRNAAAEELSQYQPLVGPALVVSYEEAGEDELLSLVHSEAKKLFEARLGDIVSRGGPGP